MPDRLVNSALWVPWALLTLSSCSTLSPLKTLAKGQEPLSGTVMAFDYDFRTKNSMIREEGCQIVLMRTDDGKGFTIDLHAHRNRAFVAAEPGQYLVRRIYCNDDSDWMFDSFSVVFVAISGKISYVGALGLRENDSTQQLKIYWDPNPAALGKTFVESLDASDRDRVVFIRHNKS